MQPIKTIASKYNDVTIWKTPDGFNFEVAGGTHATWSRSRVLTGYIWDALTAAILLHPGSARKRILVLGFGGGTVVRQLLHFLPDAKITALEIDPMMIDLARTYMDTDSLRAHILLGDGYAYAAKSPPIFDVVLDDIFTGLQTGVSRPVALHTEAIQKTITCLKPNGLFVANMITGTSTHAAVQESKRAFRNIFKSTHQVRPAKGFNLGLIGGNLKPPALLTDYTSRLHDAADRRDWQNISVRAF